MAAPRVALQPVGEPAGALLGALLSGRSAPADLRARAAEHGLPLDGGCQVVAVGASPPAPGAAQRAAGVLGHQLRLLGAPHAIDREAACVLVLLGLLDARLERALRTALPGGEAACGVGRPVTGPADVALSAADARVACELAARGHGPRVLRYADVDLATLAIGQLPAERFEPALAPVLALLDARPPLRAAVEAWLAHELDVTAAACALRLHPNTVRYRLKRLAEELGRPLRDPATIAQLHLALTAERRLAAR
jgi:purine catabolism regulator